MRLSKKWGEQTIYAGAAAIVMLLVGLGLLGSHPVIGTLLILATPVLGWTFVIRADKALRCPKCGGSVYYPARQAEWTADKAFFCPHCGEKIQLE